MIILKSKSPPVPPNRLIALREPNILTLWDSFQRTKMNTMELPSITEKQFRWSKFSPNGKYLYSYILNESDGATNESGNSLQLWNAGDGKEINLETRTECSFASNPAFTLDESKVAVFCKGGQVGVWDTKTGQKSGSIETAIKTPSSSLSFDDTGGILSIRYSDIDTGAEDSISLNFQTGVVVPEETLPTVSEMMKKPLPDIKSPDGNWTVYGGRQQGYFLRNERFGSSAPIPLAPPDLWEPEISFSKNSKFLIVHARTDSQSSLISTVVVKNLVTMSNTVLEGGGMDNTYYELSPKGKWAIRERGSKLYYWNTKTGKRFILDYCPNNPVFTSDKNETRLITNCDGGMIKFWDLWAGQDVLSISNDQPAIKTIDFSPGEDYLLTISDEAVKSWRIKF